MRSREEVLRSIEGVSFDVCVIGGGATGAAARRMLNFAA